MINNNVILNVKYIFLNFVQALFSIDPVFTWDADVQKTKIIIADRHAIDLGVAVLRPSIILQRGDLSWTYLVKGQDATNAIVNYNGKGFSNLAAYDSTINDPSNVKAYTDLLRGYVVFNAVSKNGVQAEILADKLFKNLTGFKNELKSAGIRQINNLSISQEQIVRANSDIELSGVQVSLGFLQQIHIIRDEKNYNSYAYVGETEIFENHDYTVVNNGTAIKFRVAPTDTVILDYTDAITLESHTGVALNTTADPLIYELPNSAAISGYYILSTKMIINNDDKLYTEIE